MCTSKAARANILILKYIIIETRADFLVVGSNGLGPVLAAIMHPGRLFKIVVRVSWKQKGQKPFDLTATESARVWTIMHFRVPTSALALKTDYRPFYWLTSFWFMFFVLFTCSGCLHIWLSRKQHGGFQHISSLQYMMNAAVSAGPCSHTRHCSRQYAELRHRGASAGGARARARASSASRGSKGGGAALQEGQGVCQNPASVRSHCSQRI